MSNAWWNLLKAPIYDRVDRDPAYVRYLEQSGQTPDRTRLRQTNMGQEVPAVPPQSTVGAETGYSLSRLNNPNAKGSPFTEDNRYQWEGKNKNFSHFYQSDDEKVRAGIKHLGDNTYMLDHYAVREGLEDGGHGRAGLIKLKEELEAHHGGPVQLVGTDDVVGGAEGFWRKMANEGLIEDPFGEELNKEAKSPAALEHKRKYETEYESSPARKKYRRELGAERRKRGVAGKGGGDMSHTKTGKIVVEDPHTNRARSHPSVGSTLKMVVVKAPLADLPLNPNEVNVNRRFELTGLSDFNTPIQQGQAFASSDRQARGIAVPMRGPKQVIDAHTGDGHGPHWALPAFEHIAERGEGEGRKYLEEMVRELKQKRNMPVRAVAALNYVLPFWDKMTGEGVIDSAHTSGDANDPRPEHLHYPGHPDYEQFKHLTQPLKRNLEDENHGVARRSKESRFGGLASLLGNVPRMSEQEREQRYKEEQEKSRKEYMERMAQHGRADYERQMARRAAQKGENKLKMVIVKAPQMNLMGNSAECELCGEGVDAQTAQMMNQQFGATVCMACIQREQEQINQQNDMMYHGAPMDITMRLLKNETDEKRRERRMAAVAQAAAKAKADARAAQVAWMAENEQQEFDEDPYGERGQFNAAFQEEMKGAPMDIAMRLLKGQKKLFVEGQKTLDGRPAFTPTDFAAEEQRRQATLKEQQARGRREAQRLKAAEGNATLPQFQQNPE